MKAARIHGPQDLRIDDIDEPAIRNRAVKIAVERCGICGSDLGIYLAAPIPDSFRHPLVGEEGPHVLGHEFSGYVTEVGDDVEGINEGDLVAVRPTLWDGTCAACERGEDNICAQGGFLGIHGGGGGMSETIVVDAKNVFVLPDTFTPESGALVESLAVAWHAVRISGAQAGQGAFVVGAGPIGLGVTIALRAHGLDVVVAELGDKRKELARAYGADVIDPRETDAVAYVRGRFPAGADITFDASGVGEATFTQAMKALRKGGTTVVVANFHEPVPVDLSTLMQTETRIVGSLGYTAEDFDAVIAEIDSGRLDPLPLVTSVIPLADAKEKGFDYLLHGEGRANEVKILVDPRPGR